MSTLRVTVLASLLGAGPIAACGTPAEVVELCDDVCRCEACNDGHRSACETYVEGEVQAAAAAYGCDEEERNYRDCLNQRARCVDGRFGDFEGRCDSARRSRDRCINRASDIREPPAPDT